VIRPAKSGNNQLLTKLIENVKGGQMSAARDLDQLGEAVSYLRFKQGTRETEVQEGVLRHMISPKAVLVIAMVHRDFD